MTGLCAFCSSLDLRYAGYYKPVQRVVEGVHDNADSTNQDEQEIEEVAHHPSLDDDADSDDDNDDNGTALKDVDSYYDCGALEEVTKDATSESDREEWEDEDDDDEDEDVDDPYTSKHTVPEMLASAKTCRFCGELSRLFYRWIEETYPGRSTADLFLADSEVEVTQGESMPAESQSRDSGENGSRLTSVRVKMLMRDPGHPELDNHFYWSGITLAYQRVLWEAWPRLRDVLDSMDAREAEGQSALSVWSENKPYSARHRSGRIDLRLLRRWKEACFAWHGDRCCSVSRDGHDKPQMLRLIDVDDMCLVEVPDRAAVSWVVLSYVWGRVPFFTLTTQNRALLLEQGSFDKDTPAFSLPATVADAIDATRGLGERYLWTDSLCIMQDAADDKALFVPAMDDIYGRATITIVDLGGENAFHGLPGVANDRFGVSLSGRDNTPAPEPLIVNGTRIVRAPQPTGTGYQRMDMQASCVYLQRGWTFQEALLSRRFVLFTADTVFWECPCATWREDANWEVEGDGAEEHVLDDDGQVQHAQHAHKAAAPPDIFRNSFLTVESTVVYDRLWGPTAEDFDVSYQALAHAFSRRQLSFERDGLAAFSGVLNALERTTNLETSTAGPKQPPLEFVWGLPGPYLGVALTWPADREEINTLDDQGRPVTDAPPFFYRRTSTCLVYVHDNTNSACMTTADVPFPSWSWIGWVGPVLYEELFGSLLSEHAGIRFYVFRATSPDGELVEVPQHTAFQDRWPASSKHVRAPALWRETSSTANVVDAGVVPAHIRRDPALRQIVLAFWTSCCPRLHILYEARTHFDNDIVNTADVWEETPGSTAPATFSGSWSQRPPRSWRTGLHVVECVVVGRDNLDNLAKDSRLVVLVTETVGEEDKQLHGTRRRVAALTVDEKAWNSLQTRRWEVVVLV